MRDSRITRSISPLPPRHDIDVVVHAQQLADRGAIGGFDHLHRGFGQAGGFEPFMHARRNGLIGMYRFRAAAQDACVAGFDAKSGCVRRDIGARFVNDGDHAQRHAHAADLDAGRLLLQFADFADRVRQLCNLAQPVCHFGEAFFGERQAVDQRWVEFLLVRGSEVARVCREQAFGVALDRIRGERQRAILGGGVGFGDEA